MRHISTGFFRKVHAPTIGLRCDRDFTSNHRGFCDADSRPARRKEWRHQASQFDCISIEGEATLPREGGANG